MHVIFCHIDTCTDIPLGRIQVYSGEDVVRMYRLDEGFPDKLVCSVVRNEPCVILPPDKSEIKHVHAARTCSFVDCCKCHCYHCSCMDVCHVSLSDDGTAIRSAYRGRVAKCIAIPMSCAILTDADGLLCQRVPVEGVLPLLSFLLNRACNRPQSCFPAHALSTPS